MADQPTQKLERDTALEQRMLAALLEEQREHPRSQQKLAGPSQLGGCRELLRTTLFEPDFEGAPETEWAVAAWMGTVAGAALEEIFGRRLSALEQQRITAKLERLGVSIAGAMDLVFLDGNQVTDLKSTDSIGGVLFDFNKNAEVIESLVAIHQAGELFRKSIETPDGAYELTQVLISKISKLHYYCQIATYVTGAVQAGILGPGAEGRIVFYDRSGSNPEIVAIRVSPEQIALFLDVAQARLEQVMNAQELLERTGNPALIHELRDMRPSYCFSKKVQCPVRERCWGGSTWLPDEEVTDPDKVTAAERYEEGRRLEALGKGMKESARTELQEVAGRMPNGLTVGWSGNGRTISVVRTKEAKPKAEKPKGSAFVELVKPEIEAADAAQVEALTELAMAGGPEGDEAADLIRERVNLAPNPAPDLMGALAQKMTNVAESRRRRKEVADAIVRDQEAEERAQYGGLTFPEHVARLSLTRDEAGQMLRNRNEHLLELQRKAIREAGLE